MARHDALPRLKQSYTSLRVSISDVIRQLKSLDAEQHTMSQEDARQLKIKTGVVRRVRKELEMYQKEQAAEQAKVEKLKEEGADPHDIKYAENILAESANMIPDTRQRLADALKELQALLDEFSGPLAGSEELAAARQEVDATAPLFS